MDKFVVISTLVDSQLADKTCSALEDNSIPVMLEHVVIYGAESPASGYRVLVPSQHAQAASTLVKSTVISFENSRNLAQPPASESQRHSEAA